MQESKYKRYTSKYQESRENSEMRRAFERTLIQEFLDIYRYEGNLNTKLPRNVFEPVLNEIGYTLQKYAREVAENRSMNVEVHQALESNPVPQIAAEIMTTEFRVFCLALNALKQWLSAEQASMDRVLLGGEFKSKLRRSITECAVSKEPLEYAVKGKVNYHHPMRDGRFPIPLSKKGHDMIEGQLGKSE